MYENKHFGKMVIKVQVEDENEGRTYAFKGI
jgi:hypothetical protein